jgi:hypothetical protein
MPLSAYAEWSPVSHDAEDNKEERILIQAAGCPESAVSGIVGFQYELPDRIKVLQFNRMLLDEHFVSHEEYNFASEMHWVIPDFEPFLNQWFYTQDAVRISRRMQSFSPSVISPPEILNVVIN